MAVDQQRIRDVLADDAGFVDIDIVDIIYQVYAFTLTGICWLYNPNVLFAFVLLQLLVVVVKVTELIGQDVSIRNKVKRSLSKAFLHSHYVEAHPIFACNFVALGKFVDLLILV